MTYNSATRQFLCDECTELIDPASTDNGRQLVSLPDFDGTGPLLFTKHYHLNCLPSEIRGDLLLKVICDGITRHRGEPVAHDTLSIPVGFPVDDLEEIRTKFTPLENKEIHVWVSLCDRENHSVSFSVHIYGNLPRHEAEELAARYIRDTLEDMGFTMERWDAVPDVPVRIALL